MRNRKRTKQVNEFVDKVNETLRRRNIKNEDDTLFIFACDYLLSKKMYEGFNFCKYKTIDGRQVIGLAGSAKKEDYDFLQLY